MRPPRTRHVTLRAFRRLGDLEDPAGFLAWFRRVVITVALNMRRGRRTTLLRLDDVDDVPVLDDAETSWTDAQRHRLAAALLTLMPAERRLCDRRYHGRWSVSRLAQDAGVPEPVMRKRLQRVRDKLRKEIDVSEQRALPPDAIPADLPATIVELLARPQLTELPEHPVGEVFAAIRRVFASHAIVELPEIVDLSQVQPGVAADAIVRQLGGDPGGAHRDRDRLRARTPGDAALRHRRHPQGRERARRLRRPVSGAGVAGGVAADAVSPAGR